MPDIGSISATANAYAGTEFKAQSNSKNTLTITSYIQLLAAQLQNQDVTDPMSNSEMMNQMTQMAMVQALSTMTDSMEANSAMNTAMYAAGMMGKEVTVAVSGESEFGDTQLSGIRTGVVESVILSGDAPTVRLEGDDTEYPLSSIMSLKNSLS